MGRWARAGVLLVGLVGGLVGCAGAPDTMVLERPLPSNRFHPVRQGTQPRGGAADPARPGARP
jgi:hypothetical protein